VYGYCVTHSSHGVELEAADEVELSLPLMNTVPPCTLLRDTRYLPAFDVVSAL